MCSSRLSRLVEPTEEFVEDPNERVKWALRRLYYRQRAFRTKTGALRRGLAELDTSGIRVDGLQFRPEMKATDSLYEIVAPGFRRRRSISIRTVASG